jgi:hypothetical protein
MPVWHRLPGLCVVRVDKSRFLGAVPTLSRVILAGVGMPLDRECLGVIVAGVALVMLSATTKR